MAVRCEFINLIIPISNIDKVYPGGFKKFKQDNSRGFSLVLWNDDFLFRDGAMNFMDIEDKVKKWENLGLIGVAEENGEKYWQDFCISGVFGPTLKCDWIEVEGGCAFMKGTEKGEVIGRPLKF